MSAVRIRDWDRSFEVAQSKKVKGELHWVAVPTKHDGKSYRRIMRSDDGAQIFAAWILMLQVAAKCPVRGTLADENGPLTTEDLELKTGCKKEVFDNAIKFLISKEIGWLEVTENYHATTTDYCTTSTEQDNTEQDKTSCCGEMAEPSSPPVLVFPCVGSGAKEWCLTEAKLAQYRDSFPGVDVLRECRAARQWCLDNPKRQKTGTGMPGFLSRWLTKAQNSRGVVPESNGAKLPPTKKQIAEDRFYRAQVVIDRCRRAKKTEPEIEAELVRQGFDPREAFAQMPGG